MSTGKWYEGFGRPLSNSRVIHISPNLAEQWLTDRNKRNRKYSMHNLRKIIAAVRNGEWMLNGETIKFDEDGNLLDGQHRLRAIVETGVTLEIACLFDIDPMSFPTIDNGKSRSGFDIITAAGIEGAKNQTAGVLARVHAHLLGRHAVSDSLNVEMRASNTKILELHGRFPEVDRSVEVGLRASKVIGVPTEASFVHFVASKIDEFKCNELFEQIISGENLQKGMPAYAIREKMAIGRKKMSDKDKLAFLIKTWNAFFRRDKLVMLRFGATEQFPTFDGDELFGSEVETAQ